MRTVIVRVDDAEFIVKGYRDPAGGVVVTEVVHGNERLFFPDSLDHHPLLSQFVEALRLECEHILSREERAQEVAEMLKRWSAAVDAAR